MRHWSRESGRRRKLWPTAEAQDSPEIFDDVCENGAKTLESRDEADQDGENQNPQPGPHDPEMPAEPELERGGERLVIERPVGAGRVPGRFEQGRIAPVPDGAVVDDLPLIAQKTDQNLPRPGGEPGQPGECDRDPADLELPPPRGGRQIDSIGDDLGLVDRPRRPRRELQVGLGMAEERRIDGRRIDDGQMDSAAIVPELAAHRLGEAADRIFRPRIRRKQRQSVIDHGRADIDHGALIARDHPLQGDARAVHHAEIGHGGDTEEFRFGHGEEGAVDAVAGAVYPNIDRTQGVLDFIGGEFEHLGPGDIGEGDVSRPARLGDRPAGAVQPDCAAGDQPDPPTAPGEEFGRRSADPGRSAGDGHDRGSSGAGLGMVQAAGPFVTRRSTGRATDGAPAARRRWESELGPGRTLVSMVLGCSNAPSSYRTIALWCKRGVTSVAAVRSRLRAARPKFAPKIVETLSGPWSRPRERAPTRSRITKPDRDPRWRTCGADGSSRPRAPTRSAPHRRRNGDG